MAFGGFYDNQFYAFFDSEGYIVSGDYTGQRKRVGVSLQKFSQIEKLANDTMAKAEEYQKTIAEYKKILVDHGLIQPELTPDEKIAALSGQIDELTKIVRQLVTKDSASSNVIVPEIANSSKAESRGTADVKSFTVSRDGKSFLAGQ